MAGSNREYDFVSGFETSTAPAATTPTLDSDVMNKGYADDTYAKLVYWGDAVADTTALKAVAAADRSNDQSRIKDDDKTIWVFDADSSATEDGTTIIQPNTGSGRWLKASGAGSGSGGTSSNLEALETQNSLASQGYPTPMMDNSIRVNGLEAPIHSYFKGYLIENYSSGGSTAKVVWNPTVVFDSDKDYDSITGWAAVGAGTTLAATAGSTKVGSNHFSFNKDGSAVDASIRHTLAAQTLNVSGNYRVYFWVDMPSVTGLSNIFLKIMGAATTDFSRWNLTTNSAGGAIATGYNLMFVDIKNTAASSTGGTVWTYSQLARYVEIGVTTSSAGQTYTGIKFAGLWFSHGDIDMWSPKYLEFTVADTSNKNDFKIDSATTTQDGIVTLAATVAQNYTAGISAAAAAKWYRSSMTWSQSGLIGYNSALTSGTIALEEEIRLTRVLRESLSGNYGAYIDMYTPQIYKVSAVGGSTINVVDAENHSANLLNGDSVHIFRPTYASGDVSFALLATRAMTAGSSHSSGTTTLTLTTTSIAVGDYVVKQHLTGSLSVTSATANETFSSLSYDTSPNGAQLIGSRAYPYPSFVYGHWWLGATTSSIALKDQSGNNRDLAKVGTPTLSDSFKAGKLSASGITTTSYIRGIAGTALDLNATASTPLVQVSMWIYFDASLGSDREILAVWSFHGAADYRGWKLFIPSGTSVFRTNYHNNAAGPSSSLDTPTLTNGTWNHLLLQVKGATTANVYLNGVVATTTAGAIAGGLSSAQGFYVGTRSDSTSIDAGMINNSTGLKYADLIIWSGAPLMGQADVNYLYNAGNPQFFGYNPALLRNEYSATGQSGQRLSLKAKLNRSTTAVSPYILNAGVIKTG